MRCLFAYNPISGKGKIKKKLDYIVDRLCEKFDEVEVYQTKGAGDISLLASSVALDYDVFIFSGGDGTFNEVVNGLAEKEKKLLHSMTWQYVLKIKNKMFFITKNFYSSEKKKEWNEWNEEMNEMNEICIGRKRKEKNKLF